MTLLRRTLPTTLLLTVLAPALSAADAPPTAEGVAFFEKAIRPVLVRDCFSCHSAAADKLKGGLALDTRDGLRKGGERGPAVVPGRPDQSPLILALRHAETAEGGALKMPPKKRLDDRVVADFEKWVRMGAPDPRGTPARAARAGIDLEEGRKHWAFQPPQRTAPPAVRDAAWPRGDLDRYLLAALEAKGLRPVADADPRTLLRRLTFDLTGLPPAPEEVERFARDHAADPAGATAAAADRLLASPAFGERWGRHWLDVARYGESSGKASNIAYPQAWRYRDYVIAAFNADKPFDRFLKEQIAGDLLPAGSDARRAELTVATGFLALGPKSHNERNLRQFQADLVDEQIDATFQAFQALTVACARCHDHKFDPVSQRDYTALAGIFRSTEACYGTVRTLQSNHPSALIPLPKGTPVALEPLAAERRAAIEKQIADARETLNGTTTGQDAFIRRAFVQGRITLLRSQLAQYDADGNPLPVAMGVREAPFPGDSRLLDRGDVAQPRDTVPRGFPRVLTPPGRTVTVRRGSGRRELADLLASRDNPLTARVLANRVWLHLIGRGLVPTPDNFGASGQPPSHPELLDHLALDFMDSGWSVKKLVRGVVTSRAYALSSQFDETGHEADPDNTLVWRMPRRRLEAEALRDAMLAVADRLDGKPAKGSPVAQAGEGPVLQRARLLAAPGQRPGMMPVPGLAGPGVLRRPGMGGMVPGFAGGGQAQPAAEARTVYQPVVRDDLPEMLTLFDFPDPSLIAGERASTTVPAQALFLMNNPFVLACADGLALRLRTTGADDDGKLERAYRLCYSRPPSPTELRLARDFLDRYARDHSPRAAWTALCQALLASAEFSQR